MAATGENRTALGRGEPAGAKQPADVFVVFGITGDLAKVMTFRSLYSGYGDWRAPWIAS